MPAEAIRINRRVLLQCSIGAPGLKQPFAQPQQNGALSALCRSAYYRLKCRRPRAMAGPSSRGCMKSTHSPGGYKSRSFSLHTATFWHQLINRKQKQTAIQTGPPISEDQSGPRLRNGFLFSKETPAVAGAAFMYHTAPIGLLPMPMAGRTDLRRGAATPPIERRRGGSG